MCECMFPLCFPVLYQYILKGQHFFVNTQNVGFFLLDSSIECGNYVMII